MNIIKLMVNTNKTHNRIKYTINHCKLIVNVLCSFLFRLYSLAGLTLPPPYIQRVHQCIIGVISALQNHRKILLHFTLQDSVGRLSQSSSIFPLSIVKRFDKILFPILQYFVQKNFTVLRLLFKCWLKKRSSQLLLSV